MARRPIDPRTAAEAAFKPAVPKPPEPAPKATDPANRVPWLPSAKETVSLRIDREVLEHFRAGGPGWQERLNEALRKLVGKK
jgi:uncharacterized protein (DUF4415 family)